MVKITVKKETSEELNNYLDEIIGMRQVQNNSTTRNAVFQELIETFSRGTAKETHVSLDVSDEVIANLERCFYNINQLSEKPVSFDELVHRIIEWNKEFDEKVSETLREI